MKQVAVKRKLAHMNEEWVTACKCAGVNPLNNFMGQERGGILELLAFGKRNWNSDFFDVLGDNISNGDGTAGRKFDGDKARVDLLVDGCPKALMAISDVLTFGAKKYDDHNWKVVPNGAQRYKAAMMRHILAHSSGESTDSETGISHLAHAACCIMFMLELELNKDA